MVLMAKHQNMGDIATLKGLHDQLLAEMPEGANHDSDTCALCSMEEIVVAEAEVEDTTSMRGGSVTTYTDDEVKAAVDSATAPLSARISELEAAASAAQTASTVEELEAKITELQASLDAQVLAVQAAVAERDEIVAWLEGEAKAAEEQAALEARKEERLAMIKEVAAFPDDYLDANIERFAAMSDEDFSVALDGWKAIAGQPILKGGIPAVTALHAARESAPKGGSVIKEIIGLRRGGHVDLSGLSHYSTEGGGV